MQVMHSASTGNLGTKCAIQVLVRGSEMRSPEQYSAQPGRATVQGWLTRIRQFASAAPLPVKALLVVGICIFGPAIVAIGLFAALLYAPYALWSGQRSPIATVSVALWGVAIVAARTHGLAGPRYLLLLLPPVVALLSHAGALGRWAIPCRTTAWALLWSLPVGVVLATFRIWHSQPLLGPGTGWLIALVVLGWRLAKALQDSREYGRRAGFGGALAAPYAVAQAGAGASGRGPAASGPTPSAASAGTVASPPGPPGAVRAAQAAAAPGRTRDFDRSLQPRADRQAADWPPITVEEAMGELTSMIGLAAVKDQIRSITASVKAARRRAIAGHGTEKPMQHFVFLGPPGTGKTAVARIVAKIFYAFGLLDTPAVVEAQRADLVGEYLGATAIKTNELIDSALGGVLFIDEAYSLVNESDGQGDRFGNEAVQALLKRAEDDREDLIIILAGYERQMESFLSSNPGLNSRFGLRVKFPSYSAAELMALADLALRNKGELLDPDARPMLRKLFEEIARRRLADELGNGRFVRSLLAKAGQHRDVRVMAGPAEPSPAELVTLRAEDIEPAYAELTARFRGYSDTPTVESALAELDALVGLEPVKQQVHEIAAQLQVARLRDREGL